MHAKGDPQCTYLLNTVRGPTLIRNQFDDIACGSFCPMPTVYQSFLFDSASGWQVANSAALPLVANENKAVVSQPNALYDDTPGPVHIGSAGQGFTFDVVSFQWSAFTPPDIGQKPIQLTVTGLTVDGQTRTYVTPVLDSGLYNPYPVRDYHEIDGLGRVRSCNAQYDTDFTSPNGIALGFFNLVDVSFAAYRTDTGAPAILIFDDIVLRKDSC